MHLTGYDHLFILASGNGVISLQVERILFAGEATHEGYYATVNAALDTGVRTAKKILSIVRGKN